MDTDEHRYEEKEGTRQIIGCAMGVLNELGHGFIGKPYENVLVVECGIRGMSSTQQRDYEVCYKVVRVGTYIPDQIVVDTKGIDRITDHKLGQMLNYLKITGLKAGLILNFKRAKLEWKRVVR